MGRSLLGPPGPRKLASPGHALPQGLQLRCAQLRAGGADGRRLNLYQPVIHLPYRLMYLSPGKWSGMMLPPQMQGSAVLQCPVQAPRPYGAAGTDLPGQADLQQSGPCPAVGEENLRIGVAARSIGTPARGSPLGVILFSR
jgi:hypothetical protein